MHDANIIHSFLQKYLIRSKFKTKITVNNYLLVKLDKLTTISGQSILAVPTPTYKQLFITSGWKIMKMTATNPSETFLLIYQIMLHYIPLDNNLNTAF